MTVAARCVCMGGKGDCVPPFGPNGGCALSDDQARATGLNRGFLVMDAKNSENVPSRAELLQNLADARFDRSISVAACKLLLEELRRDQDAGPATDDFEELDNVVSIRDAG